MINVLLVDDHHLVRVGINKILTSVKGLKVVGECETGEEAIKFCRNSEPDVLLMDMDMPGMGGLRQPRKFYVLHLMLKLLF